MQLYLSRSHKFVAKTELFKNFLQTGTMKTPVLRFSWDRILKTKLGCDDRDVCLARVLFKRISEMRFQISPRNVDGNI